MDVVSNAISIAARNPDAWLDMTEDCLDKGTYLPAEYFTVEVNGERTGWIKNPTTRQRYINSIILEKIAKEHNHLLEYCLKCMDLKREHHLEKASEILNEYSSYLDKFGLLKKNGHYILGVIFRVYNQGVENGIEPSKTNTSRKQTAKQGHSQCLEEEIWDNSISIA